MEDCEHNKVANVSMNVKKGVGLLKVFAYDGPVANESNGPQ